MDLEISLRDCSAIIFKKLQREDFQILNVEKEHLEDIRGYLGDYSSLKITVSIDENEESHFFFVKSLPTVPSQRSLALDMNAFFKEGRFYNHFCKELDKLGVDILKDTVPVCYFANEEMLIFEDLTLKAYKTLTPRAPLEIDYAKSGLATLAKLHASGLTLQELKSSSLVENFEEELGKSFFSDKESVKKAIESTKRGIEAVIDLTHGDEMMISRSSFKKKALEGFDLRKEFTKVSSKFRNTLLHGDPWNNNFMFRTREGRISSVIVDFQSYRYGPPAQDVMTFLHFTTNQDLRHCHMEELLQFYYDELDANLLKFCLKGLVPKSEFFESCHYFKQFALTQTVTRFQVIGMSREVSDELLSDADKYKSVMFDNKYDFIVTLCHQDPTFKKMNYEAVDELRDFYLKSV